MKQDNFPIDEVDAQTLYMVIRELHARKNMGVLAAAYKHIGEILTEHGRKLYEGGTWRDQQGDIPEDIQGQAPSPKTTARG